MKILMTILFAAIATQAADSNFSAAPTSARAQKNPLKMNDTSVVTIGAELFAKNCVQCHGVGGVGAGNVPSLAHGPAQTASDGEIFWFITKGSPASGMPPAKISETERWQVIAYIKAMPKMVSSPTASAPRVENASGNWPAPKAPFTDFRFEKPGQTHKILAKDLPAPAPETSVGNGPSVVTRPPTAWPQVPKGFKVTLYAEKLKNPRLMRTAPNGDVFLAESSAGKILVLRGVNSEGQAQTIETFAEGLERPYGIAFYPPGKNPQWVYIGETAKISRFKYVLGDLKAKTPAEKIADLPNGGGHWTRDLQFSPDGKKLFVGVGSASNVDDPDTSSKEKERADILVMNPDGSGRKIFASGIRNAGGGLAIEPKTGALWCSVNERDALGDNLVPDYITHVTEGGFYGWPWWYIGAHQDPRHSGKHLELRDKVITPDVLLQPHHASLELTFYDGKMFPKEYSGDIFSSQHGSWNRSVRTGYELIRVPLHGSGKASGDYEDFMTGFVVDNESVWGRPVGVTVASDGALLVSDGSNSIWRISFVGATK